MISVLSAEAGELLVVLADGRMGIVTFRIDGRTVSGLELKMVPAEKGGSIIPCRVASLTKMGRNTMFAGSEEGDSLVFGWTRGQGQAPKKKPRIQDVGVDLDLGEEDEADDDNDDDDDDDLYGDEPTAKEQATAAANAARSGDLMFRVHDSLLSIAPIRKMAYGQPSWMPGSEEERNSVGVDPDRKSVV